MSTLPFLRDLLLPRLEPRTGEWLAEAAGEVSRGVSDTRFCALISLASRYTGRGALAPTEEECDRAGEQLEGWTPERWTTLEAVRVALVLARSDLAEPTGELAIEEAFRYADAGELCALYRSLAHLPAPERFVWRVGEGCRTNMRSVFEASACDTPFPARFFDDVAWNQALIKCVFIGAPLWRVWGLDARLSPDLARMALDLVDERRSAHRPVQHELWLCLGPHGGERARASLEQELASSNTLGRKAAVYALARAGETARLRALLESGGDSGVAQAARDALAGSTGQRVFRDLDPSLLSTS